MRSGVCALCVCVCVCMCVWVCEWVVVTVGVGGCGFLCGSVGVCTFVFEGVHTYVGKQL